jgi:DNA-directed RNA polymerase specialized sigma24 family protein
MRANASENRVLAKVDGEVIRTILTERARFQRFVASRVGDEAAAEDLLQESLLRALGENRNLRRGEAVVPWFYRILRNAIGPFPGKKDGRIAGSKTSWPTWKRGVRT